VIAPHILNVHFDGASFTAMPLGVTHQFNWTERHTLKLLDRCYQPVPAGLRPADRASE
jgi:hypothetical protein